MTRIQAKDEAATVRLRHRPVKSELAHDVCWTCQTYWPCDVDSLLTQLAEAQEERDVAQETVVALSSVAQERDEAREKLEAVEKWALEQLNDTGHHERYLAAIRGMLRILKGASRMAEVPVNCKECWDRTDVEDLCAHVARLEGEKAALGRRLETCSRERHQTRRHKQMGDGDTWEQCNAGTCLLDRAALSDTGKEDASGS